jgi:hypothetical protein
MGTSVRATKVSKRACCSGVLITDDDQGKSDAGGKAPDFSDRVRSRHDRGNTLHGNRQTVRAVSSRAGAS